jgi:hypothetical protein
MSPPLRLATTWSIIERNHIEVACWVQFSLQDSGSPSIGYSDLVSLEEDVQVIITECFN